LRGWHREPARHSLAARGIRTRAIPNPVASEKSYDPRIYEWRPSKGHREFRGSGLDKIHIDDVISSVHDYWSEFDGSREWSEYRLEDYYDLPGIKNLMSYDDLEALYREGGHLFEIEAVYLFGSRVTGFWNDLSDLDVYIKIKSIRGMDPGNLDLVAERMRDTIDEYLHDQGRWPYITDDDGKRIRLEIPIISTLEPEDNNPDGTIVPLLIWEANR
jgi:predicted nucleotidyltransferase